MTRQAGTSGDRGFTIFEMLIVLVILALTMTLAPAVMAGLQGGKLRAASDELVWRLRETRNDAARRNAATEMVLDLSRRLFAATGDAAFRPLPAIVEAVDVQPAALRQSDGLVRIRFLADGTATGARIILRQGSRSTAVAVDWLTAVVRHND
jgi:prepilin-type N-terminal cleavage/methylation domain-containing protein